MFFEEECWNEKLNKALQVLLKNSKRKILCGLLVKIIVYVNLG